MWSEVLVSGSLSLQQVGAEFILLSTTHDFSSHLDGAVLALTAYRVYTAYWKHRFLVKNSLWRVIFMDGEW